MQHNGRMYVACVNQTCRRSGTLWEGRHQLLEVDVHEIRQSLAYNYPLGDDHFQKPIERALGRRTGFRERGRPRIEKKDEEVA